MSITLGGHVRARQLAEQAQFDAQLAGAMAGSVKAKSSGRIAGR